MCWMMAMVMDIVVMHRRDRRDGDGDGEVMDIVIRSKV